MYTGSKKPGNTPKEPKKDVSVPDGCMVAFVEYGNLYLGKITGINNDTTTVALHRGDINGVWKGVIDENDKPMTKTVNIHDIPESQIFHLTKANHLPGAIKHFVKQYM